MTWTDILNIIGNIASIITVIGGVYGLCKWIKFRKANIIATKYQSSDQCLFILYVYNKGLADAHNIKYRPLQDIRYKLLRIFLHFNRERKGKLAFLSVKWLQGCQFISIGQMEWVSIRNV